MFHKSKLFRLIGLYPPYLGAGIRVTHVARDLRAIDVQMRLTWWNRNYVGTHFGGSLYSMIDPFYMLMLMENLGRDYIVWDKSASIRFKRPGRGKVFARFRLSGEQIDAVRSAVERDGRATPSFGVDITDAQGEVVAQVDKVLSVRRKRDRRRPNDGVAG